MKKWFKRIGIGILVILVLTYSVPIVHSYVKMNIGYKLLHKWIQDQTRLGNELDDLQKRIMERLKNSYVPDWKKMKLSIIEIKIGKQGGTGVIYKQDKDYLYALTAKHILKLKGRVNVRIHTIKEVGITIKNISRKNIDYSKIVDLGIIKIPKPKGYFATLSLAIKSKAPTLGTTIYIIGHPYNFHYNLSEGIVGNYVVRKYRKEKVLYMLITAPTYRGNSGGPVIVQNEIVGIVTGIQYLNRRNYTEYLHTMAFAVSLEDIHKFLNETKLLKEKK